MIDWKTLDWKYHLVARIFIILGLYFLTFYCWSWQNFIGYLFAVAAFVVATFQVIWIFFGHHIREGINNFVNDMLK